MKKLLALNVLAILWAVPAFAADGDNYGPIPGALSQGAARSVDSGSFAAEDSARIAGGLTVIRSETLAGSGSVLTSNEAVTFDAVSPGGVGLPNVERSGCFAAEDAARCLP